MGVSAGIRPKGAIKHVKGRITLGLFAGNLIRVDSTLNEFDHKHVMFEVSSGKMTITLTRFDATPH